MPSKLGWVDFAEEDRQRMLDVVQLFRERDTRDELGLGTIRDAFADSFFPGTNTIQTRVRYMLFVPWIYQSLEAKQVPFSKIADRVRREEVKLINALIAGGEKEGVIGIDAKEKLLRLPSNIYWSGLGAWGIRLFPGSQEQYHRSLDVFYQHPKNILTDDDAQIVSRSSTYNWDPNLPKPPEGFLDKSDFRLRQEEALYLQDRILNKHYSSLLARLISSKKVIKCDFFWQHPVIKILPDNLKENIIGAQNFSETMLGAALLYNIMLARLTSRSEVEMDFTERLQKWSEMLKNRWPELLDWYENIQSFWKSEVFAGRNIPLPASMFVGNWLKLLFEKGIPLMSLVDNPEAQRLIYEREFRLKGQRARLSNPRSRELWSGASGDRQLEFRWNTAKSYISDIVKGLNS